MSGVNALYEGIIGIASADANLRDFKISGDTVKERSGLGKAFARLGDHFANKSEAGRMKIEARNATVGDAMLKMVNDRLDAKLGRIDANAEAKGLSQEAIDAKKSLMTRGAQQLRDRITILRDSKQMAPEVLKQIKSMDPSVLTFLNSIKSAEAKEKFTNLLTLKMDKNIFKSAITRDLKEIAQEDLSAVFAKDVRRGMVGWPGSVKKQGEPGDVEALHAYLDQVTKNTPEVKNFLVNTCHQSGVHRTMVYLYTGMGAVKDPNIPSAPDYPTNKVTVTSPSDTQTQDARIQLNTQDDGSIDVTYKVNIHVRGIDGNKTHFNPQQVIAKLHLPVDTQGDFILENGQPKFEITDVTIENIKQ